MADKRITDVDFLDSLNGSESFFVNQNNSIKQINKSNIVFDVTQGGTGADNLEDARNNLGLGSVATENIIPVAKGGTGADNLDSARDNLGLGSVAIEDTVPISKGGTGATTASDARTNIDAAATEHDHSTDDITSGVLPLSRGGTGYSEFSNVPKYAIVRKAGNGDYLYYTAVANGTLYSTASDTAPIFGTLPVAQGGTGAATHTANAVLTGNGTSAVKNVATASGALYATAANGAPKFGVLPIAQGGTGASSGATALKNLFAAGSTVVSSYQYGTTLPTAGTAGRIFFKKVSS